MRIIYQFSKATLFIFLFLLFSKAYSQCTPRVLPFTENFSGFPLGACNPTVGGWVTNTVGSGASWSGSTTNYAGGITPEIAGEGDQANGGVSETITLTSPPLNTTSVSAITFSFKHALYLHNMAAAGSNFMTILVETSPDKATWSSQYTNTYAVPSVFASSVNETRTLSVSGITSNTMYIRFSVSGVLFKLYGWYIDDVTVIDNATVSVPQLNPGDISIYPNPATESVTVNGGTRQSQVKIYDLTGQLIYQAKMTSDQLSIDTRAFAKGLYFVQMQNEKGILTRKIVKE